MALTYDQIRNACLDGAVLGRLGVALSKYAKTVALESDQTANHTARKALAKQVLNGGVSANAAIAYAVALESVIAGGAGTVTDANLDTAVSGAWDAIALALV